MLEQTGSPSFFEDTQADVNPYEVSDMIWKLIRPYFETKYNVELTEMFPKNKVERPTIVCSIVRRVPGREGSKIQGKGPSFVKFAETTADGYVQEIHMQHQDITLEYSVFSPSTAEVKRIAWDLERAVLETVGVLQNEIEGFQMTFEQQTVDSSLLFRQQDELIRRTIRFRVVFPVKYTKLIPALKVIEVREDWGILSYEEEHERIDSSKVYYITVDAGKKVLCIKHVYVRDTDYPQPWITLQKGTDYFVKRDRDNIMYIEWNDNYGKVPTVGETFRIDYDVSHYVKGSSITKPL